MDKWFETGRVENNEDSPPLNLLIIQREQQNKPRNINSNLSKYISDIGSGYSKQALDEVGMICYDRKIYAAQNMRRRVLDWYHLHINNPGGSRLAKKFERYDTEKAL